MNSDAAVLEQPSIIAPRIVAPGSRCTRDQREELEEADVKCGLVTNLGYFLYAEFRVLVAVLEGNKNDTVDD